MDLEPVRAVRAGSSLFEQKWICLAEYMEVLPIDLPGAGDQRTRLRMVLFLEKRFVLALYSFARKRKMLLPHRCACFDRFAVGRCPPEENSRTTAMLVHSQYADEIDQRSYGIHFLRG